MNNLSKSIATSREQSERLLAMGVKSETADMHYSELPTITAITDEVCNGVSNHETESVLFSGRGRLSDIPAWSLSRLISMIPFFFLNDGEDSHYHSALIKKEFGYAISVKRGHNDCLFGTYIENDPIKCYISIIKWLIENKRFNKEYLK